MMRAVTIIDLFGFLRGKRFVLHRRIDGQTGLTGVFIHVPEGSSPANEEVTRHVLK